MNKEIRYVKLFFIQFFIVTAIIIGISLLVNIIKEFEAAREYARIEGKASYNKDLLYRRWAASHGGVYVPVTDSTPPSPYLSFIPDRDIETTSGKKLTLVNPAYMTRQVHTLANAEYGVKGHITSLNPIRPGNKPDAWEKNALLLFEKGVKEHSGLEVMNNIEYLRFMQPMVVEKSCMKCHAGQGYKVGQIRGGISVSVPMDKYKAVAWDGIINLTLSHTAILLIILTFSFLSYKRLKKEMLKRDAMQQKVIQNEDFLRQQNYEYAALNEEYKSQNIEIQRAKEILEEKEYQLNKAQKTAKVGNWIWYIQENRLWWSDEMYRIFDIDKEHFSGNLAQVIEESIHPDDKAAVEASNKSVVLENKPIPVEYRIITKNCSIKYVYGLADEITLDSEGKSILLTGIVQDITEYKKIQEELEDAKLKAEESDKLKSAFLQNMSHEIRTPLNAICGFSSILDSTEGNKAKQSTFISIIQNASNQLLNIVTDILTVSSLETHQEKITETNFALHSLLDELIETYESQCQSKNIMLFLNVPTMKEEMQIHTDKNKITQIFNSLISNAIKFTHKGRIEIGYRIQTLHQQSFIEFFVKDSGIGIAKEYQEVIFERFRQGDPNIARYYGGTGLGLTIAKAYTEMLGGTIRLESELQKGSAFYFLIPFTPVVAKAPVKFKKIRNGEKHTILVAEDEIFNFQYIEELLIDLNLRIIHAENGLHCTQLCNENAEIALVLMDIKMPVMDGFEATKIIRQSRPELPIIAQTAYALDHERQIFESTFDDYLTKPIVKAEFLQCISKYLEIVE